MAAINKRKVLDAARKHAQRGAKQKALKEYEKLLKADPRDTKLRLEVAEAYRRWGQVDEAIDAYRKVADTYMKDGFDAKAVAVYRQLLTLDPDRYESYVPLAEVYQRMGLDSEASKALQTAADGYRKEGKKREALDLLRRMATLDPANTVSRLKVADLLRQEGLTEDAVTEYRAVAAELERQGETEAAINCYQRLLELVPDDAEVLQATARALLQLGRADRAESFASRALELDPDDAPRYELLCEVHRSTGKDAALVDISKRLAKLYRDRGDEDKAREIMQRLPSQGALELDDDAAPGAPDLELDGAAAFGEVGDEPLLTDDELLGNDSLLGVGATSAAPASAGDEEMSLELEHPLDDEAPPAAEAPEAPAEEEGEELPPADGDPEQLLAEASVYLRYGKTAQAIASLEGVIGQEPENRAALDKLGEAYSEAGKAAKAVASWVKAAELAAAAGDAAAVEVLRSRIAALDEAAAAGLAAPEPAPAPAPAPAAADVEDEGVLDDVDLELDLGDAGPDASAPEPAAREDAAGDDGSLGDEIEIEFSDDQEEAAPAPAADAPDEESAASSQRINEEFEEAEFYREQGLLDEAETIFRRILKLAPNHPRALLRLGEIEAARAGGGRAEEPGPDSDEELLGDGGEIEIEMDDDLSLDGAGAADPEDEEEASEGLSLSAPTLVEAADAAAAQADTAAAADDADEDGDDGIEIEIDDAPSEPEDLALGEEPDLAAAAESADAEPEPEPEPEPAPKPARTAPAKKAKPAPATKPKPAAPAPAPPQTQQHAEGSFDLAAELADLFGEDEGGAAAPASAGDGSFESIFADFKQGVNQTLTEEGDHETRFDLGVAYREMGLFEDAIGEFARCAEHPERRVDGLHMMALCALDLGRGEDAVNHLQQAVSDPAIGADRMAGLRFDLGRAYEAVGDIQRARTAYEQVATSDPAFPGIREKLDQIDRTDPGLSGSRGSADEAFESFDDVVAEAAPQGEARDPGAAPVESDTAEIDVSSLREELEAKAEADEPAAASEEPEPPDEDKGKGKTRGKRKRKISFV